MTPPALQYSTMVWRIEAESVRSPVGIAHTRWATHGAPSKVNAHPQTSTDVAVVHNGIIENFELLRDRLSSLGYRFHSQTDTGVVAHLIQAHLDGGWDGHRYEGLLEAVIAAKANLEGAYALAVISANDDNAIVLTREGSPLVLGVSDQGICAASDTSALLALTRGMVSLDNGDSARITSAGYQLFGREGRGVARQRFISELSLDAVSLGQYRHYMQKEIFEQPRAIADTVSMLDGAREISPNLFGDDADAVLGECGSVLILACGTSFYAGLAASYWIEEIAGVPCRVEIASEYRYRRSVANPKQLVVLISQSGETADTLAALRHAESLGHDKTLAICNVAGSALVRESSFSFLTRAGPEIGVASTKAFTTQLSALYVLGFALSKARGNLDSQEESEALAKLNDLPAVLHQVLALEPLIERWAAAFAPRAHALFLGRGHHYPVALEGALKLKEISYIHAEAYPTGELKHGPLALVDETMPVVMIAPNDALIDKLKANMQEVHARGGELYVLADKGAGVAVDDSGIHVLEMPEHQGLLSPVVHVVALQLLAYHVACVRGSDVDKPRNLAKSVTVE